MLPSGSSGEPSFLMRRDGAHADRLDKIDMAKAEADLKNATALVQKGLAEFQDAFSELQSFASAAQDQGAPVTPCESQLECDAVTEKINRCTRARASLLESYETTNTGVHATGQVVALLCGCVFAGPLDKCFLEAITYTCKIPYGGYLPLFMATQTLWQVVKASTNKCAVLVSPLVINSALPALMQKTAREASKEP